MKFELNEYQEKRLKRFKKHRCYLKGKTGAIGGELKITFTMTGIGSFVTVHCDCGKERNITDYKLL